MSQLTAYLIGILLGGLIAGLSLVCFFKRVIAPRFEEMLDFAFNNGRRIGIEETIEDFRQDRISSQNTK